MSLQAPFVGMPRGPCRNAGQYELFSDQRTRPGLELMQRIGLKPNEVKSVVDVGCGTGRFTGILAERYPEAQVLGLDSSENMLTAARKSAQKLAPAVAQRIKFECRSAADWKWCALLRGCQCQLPVAGTRGERRTCCTQMRRCTGCRSTVRWVWLLNDS